MAIMANSIFRLGALERYKLHLSSRNPEGEEPLDAYVAGNWVGWNEWRGDRDDWNRDFIFSMLQFYPQPNSYLFGGVFEVLERLPDRYVLAIVPEFESYVGRVLLRFKRPQGMMGRGFRLENYFDQFEVMEVFREAYGGEAFPGFGWVNQEFSALEAVMNRAGKTDWEVALSSLKGIYLVCDKQNGKMYVGSAYGGVGIWARWKNYIETGHGWNVELVKLGNADLDYARKNFRFALLEVMLADTPDQNVIEREMHWKAVLMTREFGYNRN
jgi:hypothetical protein